MSGADGFYTGVGGGGLNAGGFATGGTFNPGMAYNPGAHSSMPNPAAGANYFGAPPSASMGSMSVSTSMGTGSYGGGVPAGVVSSYADDEALDRPLLTELGVDFGHIRSKVAYVLHPRRAIDESIMRDSDMAGPIVFCLVLGFFLLLAGKVHFGYIYGFSAFGCLSFYGLLHLMSANGSIHFTHTFSILGYSMLPIVMLAGIAIIFSLRNFVGALLGMCTVIWCAFACTRLFEVALRMQAQRWLIAYPAFLFYACFALITIF